MALGLQMPAGHFSELLRERHTSYLRLNWFPPCAAPEPNTLGISPHRDAGFLTVLAQDVDCHSLQATGQKHPECLKGASFAHP